MNYALPLTRTISLSLVLLSLAACSKSESLVGGNSAALVVRGSANQPSIKILSSPTHDPDADLFNEQGYQEATDRFIQMDVLRRLGKAQLSELLGEKVESKDALMLGIGLPQAIEKSTARLKGEFPADYHLLEAYAAGVNRFLKEMPQAHPETMNLYHQITQDGNYQPVPWDPSDSIAILKNVSFYLSSHLQDKLTLGTVAL